MSRGKHDAFHMLRFRSGMEASGRESVCVHIVVEDYFCAGCYAFTYQHINRRVVAHCHVTEQCEPIPLITHRLYVCCPDRMFHVTNGCDAFFICFTNPPIILATHVVELFVSV